MHVIKNVGLIILGVLLGIAGSMATPQIEAQANPVIQEVQPGQPVGPIITSENIGFQLTATPQRGDVVTGKLMIRINGRWLPAVAPTGVSPAR